MVPVPESLQGVKDCRVDRFEVLKLIEDERERTILCFAKDKSQSLLKAANGKGVGDCQDTLDFFDKV